MDIATSVIIALASVIFAYVAAIKLQFAKNKETAMRDMRLLTFPLILALFSFWLLLALWAQLTSPLPLTKTLLFVVLLESFTVFFIFSNFFAMFIYYKLSKI